MNILVRITHMFTYPRACNAQQNMTKTIITHLSIRRKRLFSYLYLASNHDTNELLTPH